MRIKIVKWKPMTWHWLNREDLENKELEVIKVIESTKYKRRKSYLLQEPDKFVLAKDCIIISE